jgi:hypothetical protein
LVSVADVHALAVEHLGLDATVLDLEALESLAALVRRAASLTTPCTPRLLRATVLRALLGLLDMAGEAGDEWRNMIDETIETLTSYGDLLELPVRDPADGDTVRTLFLAPPTFVALGHVMFMLGGQLDGLDPLPSDIRGLVEYRSHTRRLRQGDLTEVAKRLRAIGWVELPRDLWLPAPRNETADQLLGRAMAALSAGSTSGEVAGLIVLDPTLPNNYYRGRWVASKRRSGVFIARREQRYGADLWSYVKLSDGEVTHLVDLPLDARSTAERPCDAAWHLQMAIDAVRGHPQVFQLRARSPAGSVIVDFFSPVPLWARRRWDVLGEEVPRQRSLFAYRFPEAEFIDVQRTLSSELWLTQRGTA